MPDAPHPLLVGRGVADIDVESAEFEAQVDDRFAHGLDLFPVRAIDLDQQHGTDLWMRRLFSRWWGL